MSPGGLEITNVAVQLALAIVGVALFLAFARLVRGPTLPDRVVALDLMGVLAVGMIAAYAVSTDQSVLLDPATVLALVGFLSTVAFAQYLERRGRDE
jgi:multicomponent Na+:H+ antiporter subunit F